MLQLFTESVDKRSKYSTSTDYNLVIITRACLKRTVTNETKLN